MSRLVYAAAAFAIMTALLVWQWHRDRLVGDCVRAGGAWDGAQSRCVRPLPSPILKRDIERG